MYSKSYYSIGPIVLLTLSFYLLMLYFKGFTLGGDSGLYMGHSDYLLSDPFGYITSSDAKTSYVGYIALVAIAKIIGSSAWGLVLIILHSILLAISVGLFYLILKKVAGNHDLYIAAGFSFFVFILNPDIASLFRYVLSDVPFFSLSVLLLYAYLMVFFDETKKKLIYYLILAFVSLIFFYFRPTSISFFMAIFLYLIVSQVRSKKIFLLCSLGGFIVWLITISIIYHSDDYLAFSKSVYMRGEVVNDQLDTYSSPPIDYIDYLLLSIKRAVYYFRYWNNSYSSLHNIYRHFYYLPIFIFSIYYFFYFFRNFSSIPDIERKVMFFAILLIISNLALHNITVIAYEFRYQLVIMPVLWIAAFLGFKKFFHACRTKCVE